MRRPIVILLVIASLTGIAAALAVILAAFFSPQRIKAFAETAASEALGRRVTIGQAHLHLWHGFVLRDVTIAEAPRYGETPLIQVERISGGILLIPLFKERQLVVPTLRVVQPKVRLIQTADGRWNIEALSLPKPKEGNKPLVRFFTPKVLLVDGQLEISSSRLNPPLALEMKQIDAELHLASTETVEGTLKATLEAGSAFPLMLQGSYHLKQRTFALSADGAMDLAVLRQFLPQQIAAPMQTLEGSAALHLSLAGKPEGPHTLEATAEIQKFRGLFPHPLRSAQKEAGPPNPLQVEGPFRLQINGELPSLWAPASWKELQVQLDLQGMKLEPLPHVSSLDRITGLLHLNAQGIRTENLMALLPAGSPLLVTGTIQNNPKKNIAFTVKGTLSGGEIAALLPQENSPASVDPSVGEVELELTGEGHLAPTPNIRSTGTLQLNRMLVRLAPTATPTGMRQLNEITGPIRITTGGLEMQGLTARLASGTPLRLEGTFSPTPEQPVTFKVTAQLPLTEIPSYLPELPILSQAQELAGTVDMILIGSGNLRPVSTVTPVLNAKFQGVAFTLPDGKRVKNLNGQARWHSDLLTVSDVEGTFMELPLRLEGSVVNFKRPEVDATLTFGDLTLKAQLTAGHELIELHALSGTLGKGTFRALGDITRVQPDPASSDPKTAYIGNLFAEAEFRVEQLAPLFQKPPAWFLQLKPEGALSARGVLKGNLLAPNDWDFNLKASSSKLTLKKIPLEELHAEITQAGGGVLLCSAQGRLAGGLFTLKGSADRTKPSPPWEGSLQIRDVDLALLAPLLDWKAKPLSGLLSLDWEGRGKAVQPDQIEGSGTLSIQEGQILELPFLGPFAQILNMQDFQRIVFQAAQGSFTLQNGWIGSQDLKVASPQVALALSGRGGFLQGLESPIEWKIVPYWSPEFIEQKTRSKLEQVLAQGTRLLAGEVYITGTWKDQKRRVVPKALPEALEGDLLKLPELLKELF